MTNEEIARFFNTTQPFILGNPNLRDPQVEGWFRTRQHFRNSSEHAILQIPVGCGKTDLMGLLLFETAQGRGLVIAPNLEICRGISTALNVAGRDCFWTSTRVLTDVSHGPFTAVLDGQDANIHDCENSHIVVTNILQLARPPSGTCSNTMNPKPDASTSIYRKQPIASLHGTPQVSTNRHSRNASTAGDERIVVKRYIESISAGRWKAGFHAYHKQKGLGDIT